MRKEPPLSLLKGDEEEEREKNRKNTTYDG
jgi:hypothetical protein